MAGHPFVWLPGAALCLLLSTPGAALAARELDIDTTEASRQLVAITCDVSDDAVVTDVCANVLLRWRLCERGFSAERLSRAALYACVID